MKNVGTFTGLDDDLRIKGKCHQSVVKHETNYWQHALLIISVLSLAIIFVLVYKIKTLQKSNKCSQESTIMTNVKTGESTSQILAQHVKK